MTFHVKRRENGSIPLVGSSCSFQNNVSELYEIVDGASELTYKQHHLGAAAKGDGNRKLTFHTATEILRQGMALFRESNIGDCLINVSLGFFARHFVKDTLDPSKEFHVLSHSQVGKETVMLKYE